MAEPQLPIPPGGDVITGPRYIGGLVATTVIGVVVVWIRMYVRIFISRSVGSDDWTMFAASLIAVVCNSFLILSYIYGIGRHVIYIQPPTNVSKAAMWLWAGEPTDLFAVYLVRLSICLFFLRLVPPKKRYIWTIWVTIILLTASNIFTSIYFFFECRPIRKVWAPKTPGACFSDEVKKGAIWLYQVTSISGDLILLIIPTTLFWRLQVPLRIKIGLIIICSLGVFTNACAIAKTVLLPVLFSTDPDVTWNVKDLVFWAPMELNIGMLCGSIPALAPLFGFTKGTTSKYPYPPSSSGNGPAGNRYHRFSKHGHDQDHSQIQEHELSDNASSAAVGLKDAAAGPGVAGGGTVVDELRVTDAELGLNNPSAVGRAVTTINTVPVRDPLAPSNINTKPSGKVSKILGLGGAGTATSLENGNSYYSKTPPASSSPSIGRPHSDGHGNSNTTSAAISRKTSSTIPRLTRPPDLTVPKERRGIGVTTEVQVQSEKMEEGWDAEDEEGKAGRWDARSGDSINGLGRLDRDWAGVPVVGNTGAEREGGGVGRGEQRAFRWNVV